MQEWNAYQGYAQWEFATDTKLKQPGETRRLARESRLIAELSDQQ